MSEQRVQSGGPSVESVSAAHAAFSWAYRGQNHHSVRAFGRMSDVDVIALSGTVAALRVLLDRELRHRAERRMGEIDSVIRSTAARACPTCEWASEMGLPPGECADAWHELAPLDEWPQP